MLTVEILLLVLLGLLALMMVLVLLLGLSIKSSLNRLELRLANLSAQNPASHKSTMSAADQEAARSSAFEEFLGEDPGRLALSKSEQAAAFREWRKHKGMNWSNS